MMSGLARRLGGTCVLHVFFLSCFPELKGPLHSRLRTGRQASIQLQQLAAGRLLCPLCLLFVACLLWGWPVVISVQAPAW